MSLSVIILTRNGAQDTKRAIESVRFADEIIVIDDFSTDETVNIARNGGARVIKRRLNNDFSSQRNFGLEKAKGDWVLFLDSDEVISKRLQNEIIQKISNPLIANVGYFLKRVDIFWGKEIRHGETGSVRLLRLAKKKAGSWERKVHEIWRVKGEVGGLNNPLFHYPHKNVKEFLSDVNYFSTLHARANMEEGKKSNIFKIIFWPSAKFLQNYFIKGGFLDGMPGFIYALIMSFHSFLAWGKLWKLQKDTKKNY